MKDFETELLQLAREKSSGYTGTIVVSSSSFSEPVRTFFDSEPIIQRWLAECCPAGNSRYRLAVGCDVLNAKDLELEYTQTEQAQQLIDGRLFVFAVDGSGYGYVLDLNNGVVYFMLGAWGGATDTPFLEAVQKEWKDIRSFVAEIRG